MAMTDETAKRFSHVKFGVRTDVGRRRKNNEDAHGEWPEQGVFCVADGMGGAQDGEVASRAVIESMSGLIPRFSKFNPPISQADRTRVIAAGVDAASAWIKNYADSQGKKGCGSTFVAVALDPADGSKATALHAGDSRVYRIRGKKIVQITRDHSVAEMAGVKDERQLNPMFRSMILRAVGVKPQVEIEETPFDLKEGDWGLICSDGLSRMVEDGEIAAICIAAGSPQAAANALVDRANELGGKDNVTVVVFRVGALPVAAPRPVHARLSPAEMKTLFERGRGDGETISLSTVETTASDELPTTEDTGAGRGPAGDEHPASEEESILPDDDEDDAASSAAAPPAPAAAPPAPSPAPTPAPPPRRGGGKAPLFFAVLAILVLGAAGFGGLLLLDAYQDRRERERLAQVEQERIREAEEKARVAAEEEALRQTRLAREAALKTAEDRLSDAVADANAAASEIVDHIRNAGESSFPELESRIAGFGKALADAIEKARATEGAEALPVFAEAEKALSQHRADLPGLLEARKRERAEERRRAIDSSIQALAAEEDSFSVSARNLAADVSNAKTPVVLDDRRKDLVALKMRMDKALDQARQTSGVSEDGRFADIAARFAGLVGNLPALIAQREVEIEERIAAEKRREEARASLLSLLDSLAQRGRELRERIAAAEALGSLEAEQKSLFAEFDRDFAPLSGVLPQDDESLSAANAAREGEQRKLKAALAELNERIARRNEDDRQRAAREAREAARRFREATAVFPFAPDELPSLEELEAWKENYETTIGLWVPLDENRYRHLVDDVQKGQKAQTEEERAKALEGFKKKSKPISREVAKALEKKELEKKAIGRFWLEKEESGRTFDSMFGEILSGWEKAVQEEGGDEKVRTLVERCRLAYGACTTLSDQQSAQEGGDERIRIAHAHALAAMIKLRDEHWNLLEHWLQAHGRGANAGYWNSNDKAGNDLSGKWLNIVSGAIRSVE